MKTVVIATVAAALGLAAQRQIDGRAWAPDPTKRWNLLALNGSGLGRALARAEVSDADESWHHGMAFVRPNRAYNLFSRWIDAGVASLGFQGRLIYRPVAKYPIRPFEVREALRITEQRLRTAFEFDPGNYQAYTAYLFFLSNDVRQSEFGSAEPAGPQRSQGGSKGTESQQKLQETAKKSGASDDDGDDDDDDDDLEMVAHLRAWEGDNRQPRFLRAFAITTEALQAVTSKDQDPERHLNRAMVWYDRFMLLAPSPETRKTSFFARRWFETEAASALTQMRQELSEANLCLQNQVRSRQWAERSAARQRDFLEWRQTVNRYVRVLREMIVNNARLDGVAPG